LIWLCASAWEATEGRKRCGCLKKNLEWLHKRFPYPRFSQAEYRRRYENIRAMMREMRLDCLLIIGGSAAYGRFNFRYVTNMMGKPKWPTIVFNKFPP
jgi:hypothetical protein